MTRRIYLSLGSNLGDREGNIKAALKRLDVIMGKAAAVSSVYETEPWGFEDQPRFLNLCAAYDSDISPEALIDAIRKIEEALGRQRTVIWGPRTIDVDVLMVDDLKINTGNLTVPHPRMWERAFVMVPLAEIAPCLKAPDGMSAALKAVLLDPDAKVIKAGRIED